VGGDEFTAQRQALTGALNTAYDELLTARSTATGLNRRRARLLGALNASHLMAEAAVAVGLAGTRPPPLVIDVVSRLADAIRTGFPPPMIPHGDRAGRQPRRAGTAVGRPTVVRRAAGGERGGGDGFGAGGGAGASGRRDA
jgi:hypothetical protein